MPKLGTNDTTKQTVTNTSRKEIKGLIQNYIYHKLREKWTALENAGLLRYVTKNPVSRAG